MEKAISSFSSKPVSSAERERRRGRDSNPRSA
jgi:hypothetical protein